MDWDLGLNGLLYLGAMSIGFGLLALLLSGRAAPKWLWPLVSAVYFGVGILVSEVWFGDATEKDLQPNIDGLSRDEVLGVGLIPVAVAVVATRLWTSRHRQDVIEGGSTASRGHPTQHFT
jgi:hypothetical protein